ncbi:hypothetical protein PC121_g5610 [Phytophthora cactorum]|nr:hypothetical protein PC120_g4405 [Phytophthora cactorum]KAG3083782.1 hypothetical protein PC121_g5610 [Phytophthora cactorum]KAG4054858.1 hypothetical protein PC123_g10024 [Phytophthora cactorum]
MKRRANLTVRSVNGLVRGPGSNCYFRLYEHLSPDDDDLEDFIPSRPAHRSLHQLVEELHDVESISKKLQTDGMLEVHQRSGATSVSLSLLWEYYLLGLYGSSRCPLRALAQVRVGDCEGVGGQVSRLTVAEKTALQPFRRGPPVAAPAAEQEDPSFAERILKRRKVDAAPSTYTLLAAIPPTSNVAERLFSSARAVLRHERHRLSPMALEMILFLKVNNSYWNVATVDACLQ